MREIKFRAWDKKSKKMRTVESIGFGELSYYKEGYPVANMIGRDCINDKDIIIHRDSYQHEIMQYTGLKDKNGIEIYEGDIVRCYGGEFCQGVYEYDESIRIDSLTNPFTMLCLTESENLEVVGNIYKNPELLEGVDND